MNVMRKILQSFHKLTVKYCCKYFARDPLDFGKVNWQVLPPTHTSLPLLTNQLALQNQKHNTQTTRQTYISIHLCLLVQMKMVKTVIERYPITSWMLRKCGLVFRWSGTVSTGDKLVYDANHKQCRRFKIQSGSLAHWRGKDWRVMEQIQARRTKMT